MRKRILKRCLAAAVGTALFMAPLGACNIFAEERDAGQEQEYITNGGFEDEDFSAWDISSETAASITGADGNFVEGKQALNFYTESGETFTITQKISHLPAGNYELSAQSQGDDGETVSVVFNGEEGDNSQTDSGWGNWVVSSGVFKLAEDAEEVVVGLKVVSADGAWGQIDCVSLVATDKEPAEQVPPAESGIYVKKISGLDEDFIRGMDISSIKAEYDSGVTYKDFDGNTLALDPAEGEKGFFGFLKECGVNWVRLRVWNDPYDAEGRGYGGGNNDLGLAEMLGKLATDAGIRVLVDFHYSDFWADPERQNAPKAWAEMNLDEKAEALGEFTLDSLQSLSAAGVDVGMVQVGNETTNGIAGEYVSEVGWEGVAKLMQAGCEAVRKYDEENDTQTLVALHFTDPGTEGKYEEIAKALDDNKVDYDVFASSYYPNIHGSIENLTAVMKSIADQYGKKLLVAETSFPNTLVNGDGGGMESYSTDYTISAQGQANCLSDIIRGIQKMGDNALGIMYWEPAWIPVGIVPDWDEYPDEAQEAYDKNKELWNEFGSGWTSDYAKDYDEKAQWAGGSGQDHLALFDFDGNPLESINIFNYIYTGTTAPRKVTGVKQNIEWNVIDGTDWDMPVTVPAIYTDDTTEEVLAAWDEEQVKQAREGGKGVYDIEGTVDLGDSGQFTTTCSLSIQGKNWVENPGFEEGDAGWTITGDGMSVMKEASNVYKGDACLKFYTAGGTVYEAKQTVTLDAGIYELSAFVEGGDVGDDAVIQIVAEVKDGEKYTDGAVLTGWQEWKQPTISNIKVEKDGTEVTVGVYMDVKAGGWGAWDEFYMQKIEDLPGTPDATEPAPTADVTGTPAPTADATGTPAPTAGVVQSLTLDNKAAEIGIGEELQLNVTVNPADAANSALVWTSSDAKTATVSDKGLVSGVAEGKAVITVATQDGKVTASCEITVKDSDSASTESAGLKKAVITVKKGSKKVSSVTVKKGKKVTLALSVTSNAKISIYGRTKKDKKVATASIKSKKLTIKGVKKGTSTVKLKSKKTSKYKEATKTIKITVK